MSVDSVLRTAVTDHVAVPSLDPALARMLRRIRLRAMRRVAWLRELWGRNPAPGSNLAVAHAEVDAVLADRDTPEAEAAWYASAHAVHHLNREIDEVEAEMARDRTSRLAQLPIRFGLSPAEFDTLQLCLGCELDPDLNRVYAYLQDHAGRAFPTQQLAARLFGHGRGGQWTAGSPLRRWELVTEKETGPGQPAMLACDPLVRNWVQGIDGLDEALVGVADHESSEACFSSPRPACGERACFPFPRPVCGERVRVRGAHEPLLNWPVEEAAAFIARVVDADPPCPVRFCIVGPPGTGRVKMATLIAGRRNLPLLAIDIDRIDDTSWPRAFLRGQRQARLDGCALAWYGDRSIGRQWPRLVPPAPVEFLVYEAGQTPAPSSEAVDYTMEMPVPSLDERRRLWLRLVPVSATWPADEFHKLVTQHRASVGEIVSIAEQHVTTVAEAEEQVRAASRNQLGELAQLLECPFRWEDLVVGDSLRAALDDLAYEAAERAEFWEKPEARRLFPQGRGLLALFSGPPGTGKTMAAQVIAAHLGLDLFRIDLSTVVSKYVGETSKNLERVLSRAARMDAVLFFDEADALFGKRTEIKDAHDRFANTDTGYLLQAIENYQGVALLASNKKGNIDPAFIRRIRYVMEFPKPDAAQRELIWRKVVAGLAGSSQQPAQSPSPLKGEGGGEGGQSPVNRLAPYLKRLAAGLELTGAQIKLAILAAVFGARHDGKPLAAAHLLRGVDRELAKDGRSLSGREREMLAGRAG